MKTLIIPGTGGSGPDHWQSLWENTQPNFIRVQQRDWNNPTCDEWVKELEQAIVDARQDIILVSHSLGCHTVAHWASRFKHRIKVAMLVAPPDLYRPDCPEKLGSFKPVPMTVLPFRSLLVASSNDPYAKLGDSKRIADAWGCEFRNIGPYGHINADGGMGEWRQGLSMLREISE